MSILDEIVSSSLCHGKCAHNEDHGVVVVWSSGAEEQLEAIVEKHASKRIAELEREIACYQEQRDSNLKTVEAYFQRAEKAEAEVRELNNRITEMRLVLETLVESYDPEMQPPLQLFEAARKALGKAG